jgi:hypothetical protein
VRLVLCVACIACTALAQSTVEPPQLGMMLDTKGQVRPVIGVAGSITLGDPVTSGALSVGCGRGVCLFKTRSAVAAQTSGFGTSGIPAPPGPALFAFAANTTLVYFPLSRQLARWHDGQLDPVPVALTGEVLSLRVGNQGNPEFAVRRDGGTWIVAAGDEVSGSIPVENGPVMLLPGVVLYTSPSEVILRRSDASELHFAVSGVQWFSRLGQDYIQIHAGRTNAALCTGAGRERIFLLPEPAP